MQDALSRKDVLEDVFPTCSSSNITDDPLILFRRNIIFDNIEVGFQEIEVQDHTKTIAANNAEHSGLLHAFKGDGHIQWDKNDAIVSIDDYFVNTAIAKKMHQKSDNAMIAAECNSKTNEDYEDYDIDWLYTDKDMSFDGTMSDENFRFSLDDFQDVDKNHPLNKGKIGDLESDNAVNTEAHKLETNEGTHIMVGSSNNQNKISNYEDKRSHENHRDHSYAKESKDKNDSLNILKVKKEDCKSDNAVNAANHDLESQKETDDFLDLFNYITKLYFDDVSSAENTPSPRDTTQEEHCTVNTPKVKNGDREPDNAVNADARKLETNEATHIMVGSSNNQIKISDYDGIISRENHPEDNSKNNSLNTPKVRIQDSELDNALDVTEIHFDKATNILVGSSDPQIKILNYEDKSSHENHRDLSYAIEGKDKNYSLNILKVKKEDCKSDNSVNAANPDLESQKATDVFREFCIHDIKMPYFDDISSAENTPCPRDTTQEEHCTVNTPKVKNGNRESDNVVNADAHKLKTNEATHIMVGSSNHQIKIWDYGGLISRENPPWPGQGIEDDDKNNSLNTPKVTKQDSELDNVLDVTEIHFKKATNILDGSSDLQVKISNYEDKSSHENNSGLHYAIEGKDKNNSLNILKVKKDDCKSDNAVNAASHDLESQKATDVFREFCIHDIKMPYFDDISSAENTPCSRDTTQEEHCTVNTPKVKNGDRESEKNVNADEYHETNKKTNVLVGSSDLQVKISNYEDKRTQENHLRISLQGQGVTTFKSLAQEKAVLPHHKTNRIDSFSPGRKQPAESLFGENRRSPVSHPRPHAADHEKAGASEGSYNKHPLSSSMFPGTTQEVRKEVYSPSLCDRPKILDSSLPAASKDETDQASHASGSSRSLPNLYQGLAKDRMKRSHEKRHGPRVTIGDDGKNNSVNTPKVKNGNRESHNAVNADKYETNKKPNVFVGSSDLEVKISNYGDKRTHENHLRISLQGQGVTTSKSLTQEKAVLPHQKTNRIDSFSRGHKRPAESLFCENRSSPVSRPRPHATDHEKTGGSERSYNKHPLSSSMFPGNTQEVRKEVYSPYLCDRPKILDQSLPTASKDETDRARHANGSSRSLPNPCQGLAKDRNDYNGHGQGKIPNSNTNDLFRSICNKKAQRYFGNNNNAFLESHNKDSSIYSKNSGDSFCSSEATEDENKEPFAIEMRPGMFCAVKSTEEPSPAIKRVKSMFIDCSFRDLIYVCKKVIDGKTVSVPPRNQRKSFSFRGVNGGGIRSDAKLNSPQSRKHPSEILRSNSRANYSNGASNAEGRKMPKDSITNNLQASNKIKVSEYFTPEKGGQNNISYGSVNSSSNKENKVVKMG